MSDFFSLLSSGRNELAWAELTYENVLSSELRHAAGPGSAADCYDRVRSHVDASDILLYSLRPLQAPIGHMLICLRKLLAYIQERFIDARRCSKNSSNSTSSNSTSLQRYTAYSSSTCTSITTTTIVLLPEQFQSEDLKIWPKI